MSTVLRIGTEDNRQTVLPEDEVLDTRIALVQALMPLGLQAVEEVLRRRCRCWLGRATRGRTRRHNRVRWGPTADDTWRRPRPYSLPNSRLDRCPSHNASLPRQ